MIYEYDFFDENQLRQVIGNVIKNSSENFQENNILSKIIYKNGKNCKIVLTGGYSYLFKKHLYKKAKIEKDITMHGIIKIYRNFII